MQLRYQFSAKTDIRSLICNYHIKKHFFIIDANEWLKGFKKKIFPEKFIVLKKMIQKSGVIFKMIKIGMIHEPYLHIDINYMRSLVTDSNYNIKYTYWTFGEKCGGCCWMNSASCWRLGLTICNLASKASLKDTPPPIALLVLQNQSESKDWYQWKVAKLIMHHLPKLYIHL